MWNIDLKLKSLKLVSTTWKQEWNHEDRHDTQARCWVLKGRLREQRLQRPDTEAPRADDLAPPVF